jgi:hypothetical protein
MKNTYWFNNGRFQSLYDAVKGRIPREGKCPRGNPALERLRKACNAYYRFNNDGDMFRMGMGKTPVSSRFGYDNVENMTRIEVFMDSVVLAAYKEQFP